MRPACHGPASLSTQKTEPSFKNRSPVRSVPRSKHFRDSQHYKDTPKSLSMTYTSRGSAYKPGGLPPGHCLPHLLSRPLGHAHSSHNGHLALCLWEGRLLLSPFAISDPGAGKSLPWCPNGPFLHHHLQISAQMPPSRGDLLGCRLPKQRSCLWRFPLFLLHFPPPDGMCGPYVLHEMQAPRGVEPVASAHPALAHTRITLLE